MSQAELSESKLPHEILSVQCDSRCDMCQARAIAKSAVGDARGSYESR